ncbi:hypothetical protein JHK87_033804 [Glycine soja]|nr:hypothetical protein JHK87_033804 [Glycine soja]
MMLTLPVLLNLLILYDLLLCLPLFTFSLLAADADSDTELLLAGDNATALLNALLARSDDGSFANMIDRALEREFPDNEQNESEATLRVRAKSVALKRPNSGSIGVKAILETVARVKPKKNESKEEKSFQFHDVFNLDNENRAEDMPTLIDRKLSLSLQTVVALPLLVLDNKFD